DQWNWTQHAPFKDVYATNHRSVYLMTQRFQRHPYLALFDGPDTNTTTEQRPTSTVPLQALFLMNNSFVKEQAEGFARRIVTRSTSPLERFDAAFQNAFGRFPTQIERERGENYISEYQAGNRQAESSHQAAELEAWASYCRILVCANEFVYL